MHVGRVFSTLVALGALACGDGDLPGHRFELTLTGSDDQCSDGAGVGDEERYTYRVVTEGAAVSVYIGDDLLGTGSLSGCDLRYTSPPWTESRPSGDVRWQLSGEAVIALGDACKAEDGWVGTEEIEVIETTDDDVPGGCRYRYDVTGSYGGFVEGSDAE